MRPPLSLRMARLTWRLLPALGVVAGMLLLTHGGS